MKLNYHVQFDRVRFIKKTRLDNDVIDRIGTVYVKIKIELSLSIGQDVVYHEK